MAALLVREGVVAGDVLGVELVGAVDEVGPEVVDDPNKGLGGNSVEKLKCQMTLQLGYCYTSA